MQKIRLLIDAICKYIVLFAFTSYIGVFVWHSITTGTSINLPDWIVMLFALVFQYFFRRSPKEADNAKDNKVSTETPKRP